MTTNHIDTLTEWYESAERITKTNLPNDGDTIIYPGAVDGSYVIEPDTSGWESQIVFSNEECRILHRAPAPKPAWHDAKAVLAHIGVYGLPRVLVRDHDGLWVDGLTGKAYLADSLRDVTPLIEQKVTDEMVDRLRDAVSDHSGKVSRDDIRAWVRAALGLDPA